MDDVINGRWVGKSEFKPRKKGQFNMGYRLLCDGFLKRIGG